ncbi:alpha/beta hydrolase [Microcoleus sp. FACHB-831]|uniref:alpha/beta fold hydrolase n=1 Tax=Microcoleus sp. FACHB-831 TaxID=2692827 RepID=UPI0016843EB2|nr:alpha/beta hydrolase [Microcoleus sp. FACHB-831]MBD1920649.1 alpha/beta hydrolase [Microcoleus sp. FACHB-831]
MPEIEVRGVTHYYEWIKTGAGENKPVMVFVHGWGGSGRYWESTARAFSDTFDCLLYDMRGFGRSKLPQQPPELAYEMEDYADDLAVLLDTLQLSRVYINAHSVGASVATMFLNRYSDRVERAILTCSGIFEYEEKSFKAFHQFGGYVVKFRPRWLGWIPFVDKMFMARFLHRPLPRAVSRAFLDDFLVADYAAALGTMLTSVSEKAAQVMPSEFAKLTVPTLLVAGERDIIIPAAMGRMAASLSDKVEYVEIANTAHFPMLEDPVTYLRLVREFLGLPAKANA